MDEPGQQGKFSISALSFPNIVLGRSVSAPLSKRNRNRAMPAQPIAH